MNKFIYSAPVYSALLVPAFFALLLTFGGSSLAQSLAPRPATGGMVFSYKPKAEEKLSSVAVAGAFNGWSKTKNVMTQDAATGVWSVTAKLEAGREYHYKFVLNDSLWITDPNAPDVTQDDWRNGIVVGIEAGKPYVSGFQPARNLMVKKVPALSAKLVSEKGISAASVNLTLNGMPLKFALQRETLTANLPDTLSDREYLITLSFNDTLGTASAKFSSTFILDRIEPQLETPDFYRNAVMYEIHVRKFFDTNGDSIGDLNGVTAKLDYIRSLGANVIWLMPVNPSPYSHGYSITDYFEIANDLGTKADFKRLLDEAHRRDMKVLMDLVINHADSTHPYFQDAYKNPSSKYAQWFQFTAKDNSDWEHFGGSRFMPKLNFFNRDAETWVIEIAKFWQAFGVDGFRCDAAKEPPHQFWKRLRTELKAKDKNFLLLGEVWDNANFIIPYFRNEFDAVFDYPLFYPLGKLINGSDKAGFIKEIENIRQSFPKNAVLVRFLGNHDNTRALSLFGNDTLKLYQALTLLWTLPGTPMIYYGDEAAMTGTLPPDAEVRKPMKWEAATKKNPVWKVYQRLSELRRTHPTLTAEHSKGESTIEFLETASPNVLSYLRKTETQHSLVVMNLSDKAETSYGINLSTALRGKYRATMWSAAAPMPKRVYSVDAASPFKPLPALSPRAAIVIDLKR